MEKPFYEFDLTEIQDLGDELEKMYEFSNDLENYKCVVYRGYNQEYANSGFKKFNNYNEAKQKLDELLYDWEVLNPTHDVGQINLSGERLMWEDYPKIHNWIKNKTIKLFKENIILSNFKSETKIAIHKVEIDNPLLTLYSKGCILTNHNDGIPPIPDKSMVKVANLLLYLNKGYKKEWGGCFIVNNKNVVVPEFGKLVFLNFANGSDPSHQITKVVGDVNRIALLFNVKYKTNQKEFLIIE